MSAVATSIAAAQQALAAGDTVAALNVLAGLGDPAAIHLRALALRRAGRNDEARAAFEQVLAVAPNDPQLLNNFANLLRQTGERDKALALYDRALDAQPGYRDAAFNRALLLAELGRLEAALAGLEALCATHPGDARAHSVRGSVLRELERHREAAGAYERAIALQPTLPTALKGRAQVALERGEEDAADRFQRAVAADPADMGTIHGYAEALEAGGRTDVTAMLENLVTIRPDWIDGHALLARIRAEQGDGDCTAAMREAAAKQPGNRDLALALAATLAAAGRWREAVGALPAGDVALNAQRAQYLVEAGEPAEALKLLGDGGAGADRLITIGRAHYSLGEPEAAIAALEHAVAVAPDSIGAWGLLELGWRLTGDARADWLSGQPGLVGARDLGLNLDELVRLAEVLRRLHRTRAHPIGQSLRGGTQTRGRLFWRQEPELARLHDALSAAVAAHMAGLPAADLGHPLLRHRDAPVTIAGSWSVRLTASGFHVNHIHPGGLLSSACYISLPETIGGEDSRDGWLELGRPPRELGVALEPLASIEPRPGRLALFPSFLFHGTRPFRDGERLTVAFDVVAR